MARMIPSFVDDQTPPGERAIFNVLAGGPDDWVVLHSLDLAPWNQSRRTEIDFVVIIPDTGIICIEVKSHLNITFDGHRWYPSDIRRSPFKQAADGRFTFYRRMRELAPRFKRVPVVHICIFPQARFDLTPNMSVAPWELMDTREFKALNNSKVFCEELKARLSQSIEQDVNLQSLCGTLSTSDLDSLVETCVPVQKRIPGAREELRHREEMAESILREQQKPVLRLAELNDRLIITGGAGTGKTLIAMELAQRMADKGHRVALLCFNKLVGDWMKQQIGKLRSTPPNLVVGRAIRVMAEMASVAIPVEPTQEFWEIKLPQQLEDRLTDPDLEATSEFDFIVLDEAQDILAKPRIWQCLTVFLRSGLGGGSFVLLGDFEHQVLKDREQMKMALKTHDEEARPARWHLSENCRNYRIVGDTALRLGGMSRSVYSGYLRTGGGMQNYNIVFYDNDEGQISQIKQWLREFKDLGYKASEITLLSFRSDESSAAARLKQSGYQIHPAWQSGSGSTYASIHAFKGMENIIIILTDVILSDQDFHRDLFYTGMTRATECVRILCADNSKATLSNWLSGKE